MAAGSAYHHEPEDTLSIRATGPQPGEANPRNRMRGWITLAGAFLLLIGLMNVIWGISALTHNDNFREGSLVWSNLTFWGWIILAIGVAQAATGAGLLAKKAVAGLFAMLLAGIAILFHFIAIGAYPIWSVIMIVGSALVIWAVIAGADELD
jgi:hypothetical protein